MWHRSHSMAGIESVMGTSHAVQSMTMGKLSSSTGVSAVDPLVCRLAGAMGAAVDDVEVLRRVPFVVEGLVAFGAQDAGWSWVTPIAEGRMKGTD